MLLVIDAGNTNVVFAVYDGETARGQWRCATDPRKTGDEYAVWLLQLMAMVNLGARDIGDTIIASVVPDVTFNLKRLCKDHFHNPPLIVGDPGVELGIEVRMDRPQEVGADRLVNAVATVASYSVPAIVIDFGTATTFDVIDASGAYCGGAIAPGIHRSLEALEAAAAKLPRVDIRQPDRVIGKNTVAAMQSGVFWGYIGLIEGLVTRIEQEAQASMTVIGTGGLAVLFARATNRIHHIDGDLTLRGLRLIHQRNKA
ncbi:MAG: type III pantothenate kinase [Azospirillaceae bacterium]|nr:type III pantothenate kinase [Azospirillaceae bacterium]